MSVLELHALIYDHDLCNSQIEASTFPLRGQPPGHLKFWTIFVQIPLRGPKNCLNAPTPGKITRLLF